jgi:hypothetical protein
MSSGLGGHLPTHLEPVYLYALQVLPAGDVPAVEAQIAGCPACQRELEALRPIIDAFVAWPTGVLRPSVSLWERLTRRISSETNQAILPAPPPPAEPEWEEVAPGISCKLLSTDEGQNSVTMLVRLSPGTEYPPHTHAGVEELYMLEGELLVNDRKLCPGDYLKSAPGTADRRVWSATGCTGVLLTSPGDLLA